MSPSQKRRRRGFEYNPLQFNSFRLLELISGHSLYADIHCRLRDYQLDSAPPYEALSYTWGDEKSACRISLDGLPFHIRPNLRDALRRLRQPRSTRIIWIDAICIDQNSADEKSVQVPLMRKIYTRAERVIAWLGEETFDSGMALDFIPYLTEVAKFDTESIWLFYLENYGFLRRMMSLVHLFSRPWWQRMWIIQEVALAPDVLVVCGSRHIRWSTFHVFIIAWMDVGHMSHYRNLSRLQITALRTLGMLVSGFSEALARLRLAIRTNSSVPQSFELSNLLWSFKYRSVTNPRDKIYGLLGLLSDHGVQVNYSKSPKEIYVSFFSSCLLEDRGLDWFRWMTGECYEPNKLCLPSWVPDFGPRAITPISSFLPNPVRGETQRVFFAARQDRSRPLSTIQFEDDHRTLILRGRSFDVVSQCGRIFPFSDDIVLGGRATEPILSHWKKMAMDTQLKTYQSRTDRENAFWRTILTDRQIEGLHFKENAGWNPAQRLLPEIQYIPPKNAKEEQELLQAMENRQLCLNGRRFCITRKGRFCLLPPTASKGDLICILLGGEVPYVLRRIDNQSQDYYTMVGECYVHGIMDGEAISDILERKDVGDIFRLQ
ncbi:HET-domain-containing protein [Bimuria novae-zelandiae CBS 107.79]|uniref:HET-domain-containing protein n=1 Tax=Bimuria novae-zelandiae CBS 107.79 TaxID=1447943 RepID=A0A6A5UM73_9PLEO|nr:HET-domain-containing protein [Bimuria novae-zelandiae CBS 107.79]